MNISKLANQVLSLLGDLGDWTQHQRVLRLNTPLGPNQLMAESFTGVESLSEGFKFEIIALSGNAHLALRSLIGQTVLLELMTANASTALRPFHGHVTRVETLGSNGGLARYKLIVEPWTAFMALRRDSTTYQDMSVLDILESIFKDYQGQGKLVPAWRLEIADLSAYPKRSLTTQYQESDLAFVQRLMSEEGLFSWVEHLGDPASATLGSHTLVIADNNAAFKPNAQASINFTQPGAVMKSDSMDRWRSERRWQTTAVEVASWDYRSINTRPVVAHSSANNSSDSSSLVSQDAPGAYSYESRALGQRLADLQLQAVEVQNKIFTGAGTVRTLSPGTTFSLLGQAGHDLVDGSDESNFVVLRVVHQAHNNLSADLHSQLEQALGQVGVSKILGELSDLIGLDNLHATGKDKGERPLYRNRVDAIRSTIPYRSLRSDQHGQLLHPKPTVAGQQSAIVVGPAGNVIYTDRDHRIKLQFHWQRGQNAHCRLAHPQADGHTGAPANEQAGTWVRVATSLAPVAGANWGSNAIPRIGQEVLVDFIEGDIDRPVVIGSLYNGKGNTDAQYNQVASGSGVATGNAPSWFPGEKGGHAHPASLSGIKSQSMGSSQQGTGGYNQLVFDDSPQQSRTSLQQHAVAHQGTAELNLGHLRHQSDNQRLNKVGFGTELKTPHSAALRAGQGMLISTDARANATSTQLDSREAQAQVESSQQLQTSLATTAQKHKAKLKDEKKQDEPEAKKLPAIKQQEHSATVLKASAEGQAGEHGGKGKVTAYSEAQLQLSSPAGIALTTPKDAILNSGNTSSITAGQDINLASQGNQHHAVKAGISLFTYGKASNQEKPNQETGIKLHAASGKLSSQSQSDKTSVTADKNITVTSTTKTVMIAANKHVLMTAMGAFLKLEGGNIMLHGPGKVVFKASMKELAGPGSASAQFTLPNVGELKLCEFKALDAATNGDASVALK
ncbi:type VI secretion system Vgr family protein [Undibacterium sp. Ren11W]|uniref:type VI secretion system Vgr family protein n=1 Tax=Undibacterium sp. Ren11W TaxID=3413045 RepID=UPI003BF3B5F3